MDEGEGRSRYFVVAPEQRTRESRSPGEALVLAQSSLGQLESRVAEFPNRIVKCGPPLPDIALPAAFEGKADYAELFIFVTPAPTSPQSG